MAVFESFRDGWTALSTTPTLLVAGGVLVVLSLSGALEVGPAAEPAVDLAVVLLFPFALGGFIEMTVAAVRDGEGSLRSYLRAGAANYLRLVGAWLLFVVGLLVVLTVVSTLSLVPLALAFAGGPGDLAALGAGVGMVLTGVGTVLGVVAAVLFFQFFSAAIVAEDRHVVDAFRRSAGLVRRNLASAAGFSLAWLLAVGAVPTPETLLEPGITEAVRSLGLPAGTLPVLAAVVGAVTVVGLTYCYTVYVAYFLRLTGERPAWHRTTGPDTP